MSAQNELRVFISSTFRDLQEEREHLVKKIFPEIRDLCRRRGVTFTDVDLRWGLTEEQAALGTVIRTCLEEVDKCRPYFIGMIGNRYGWVPELHDVLMDPDLLAKYPFVEELTIEGASVTEMEFVHGVFDAPSLNGVYAFFYHRSGDTAEADDQERLDALIDRVRSTERPYREFTSVEELGETVRSDLVAMIEENWPEEEEPSDLDLERRAHAAFAASRTRAYIPNPYYLKEFSAWLAEGDAPLVITGASGLGKSSLVAYLTEYYHKKNRDAFIIAHYVGASRSSGTGISVMRHVVEAIRLRFEIDDEIPSKPEELQGSFPNWLFRCEHLAKEAGIDVLIVIDAVNQLDQAGERMSWLPETIPSGVKLLISTTPGDAADRLAERPWSELRVEPLEDARIRQSIVVRYLGEFRKGVSPAQLRSVIDDEKASSPLYLRLIAEELRLHGEHETLDEVIDRYTGRANLLEVFETLLERMERDYGKSPVRDLLSLIVSSRSGLSEDELLPLLGISRLDLSRLLFAFDYHLLRRGGLLDCFHDYLQRAVEKRYLSEESRQRDLYDRLATYFEEAPVTLRSTQELVHLYRAQGEQAKLERVISEISRFELLWRSDPFEVLGSWAESRSEAMVAAYRAGRERWVESERPSDARQVEVLGSIVEIYGDTSHWVEAEGLERERLELLHDQNNRVEESRARASLSSMLAELGRIEEAEDQVRRAESIARELDDRMAIIKAVGTRGTFHMHRGEYVEALTCYREIESIARELGDRRSIAAALGNRGNLHSRRGEYDEAFACYREAESIARELGDKGGIARAVGNRGIIHFGRREYSEALDCYREQESIARALGSRMEGAIAIANRANVYTNQGKYSEALDCYHEVESIARTLGAQKLLVVAFGSRGNVHYNCGEYAEALDCYRELEEISRRLKSAQDVANAVGNRGRVHYSRGEYSEALDCYREQESIARGLNDRPNVATVLGSRGNLHLDRGEYAEALDCYREQESIAREMGDRRRICSAVGNRGSVHLERGEYAEALSCFREAAEGHRAIGFLFGLSSWLTLSAITLLELVDTNGAEVPGDLRERSLREAREHAAESVRISGEISKSNTLFAGRVLLARITAAEGNSAEGVETLRSMLADVDDDIERAELHYRMWKLGANDADHRAEALRLYEPLYAATPKHEYHQRIGELDTVT